MSDFLNNMDKIIQDSMLPVAIQTLIDDQIETICSYKVGNQDRIPNVGEKIEILKTGESLPHIYEITDKKYSIEQENGINKIVLACAQCSRASKKN